MKMPDLSGIELPEMGDSSTSIIITIGILLIGFLIFRKLIKWAALAGFIFLVFYFISK